MKTRPQRLVVLFLLSSALLASGCRATWGTLDPAVVRSARATLHRQDFPPLEEYEEVHRDPEPRGTIGEAILGTVLAIFPGVIVHGTGHFYAGDRSTARKLSRVGQFGYLLTGAGVGLGFGAHAAMEEDLDGLGVSLYSGAAVVGGAGILYLLSAWVYDVVDTPRAVLSGGRPPARTEWVDALDLFD